MEFRLRSSRYLITLVLSGTVAAMCIYALFTGGYSVPIIARVFVGLLGAAFICSVGWAARGLAHAPVVLVSRPDGVTLCLGDRLVPILGERSAQLPWRIVSDMGIAQLRISGSIGGANGGLSRPVAWGLDLTLTELVEGDLNQLLGWGDGPYHKTRRCLPERRFVNLEGLDQPPQAVFNVLHEAWSAWNRDHKDAGCQGSTETPIDTRTPSVNRSRA